MAEKKAEESSDSEDYLSADEGLGNSRGSENRPKLDRFVTYRRLSLSSNVPTEHTGRTVQHTSV